jgi:hypothetical protein
MYDSAISLAVLSMRHGGLLSAIQTAGPITGHDLKRASEMAGYDYQKFNHEFQCLIESGKIQLDFDMKWVANEEIT